MLCVNLPIKHPNFGPKCPFSILAFLAAIFCNHSKFKCQINTQSKPLNHVSKKKILYSNFYFFALRGEGAKTDNANPSLSMFFSYFYILINIGEFAI